MIFTVKSVAVCKCTFAIISDTVSFAGQWLLGRSASIIMYFQPCQNVVSISNHPVFTKFNVHLFGILSFTCLSMYPYLSICVQLAKG